MVTKLGDIYAITNTEQNIFYSAYLKNKLQYNDVDPDKKLCLKDESDLSKEESGCLKEESDCLKDNYSIENNVNETSNSDLEMLTVESGNNSE
jgi:hypothetical protein